MRGPHWASGANDCLEITALRARTPYHELWGKSNLLMIMRHVALIRLNLLKKQLGRPLANG